MFNTTTGIAHLGQRALATNVGCTGFGEANGSVTAGVTGVPIILTLGPHTIRVDWKVSWTLNVSLWSANSLYPATECTWWGIDAALYNSVGGTMIWGGGGFGATVDPTCLFDNSTYRQHHTGLFSTYLNGTLAAGTYYVSTDAYIFSGTFVNDPGTALTAENLGTNGNFARLVSITVM